MKKIIYVLSSTILLTACESRTIEEISSDVPLSEKVFYSTDIKPIMDTNCNSCHSQSSPGAYKKFDNYNDTKNNIETILDRIQKPANVPTKMPLFGTLSPSQIETFLKWKQNGLPEK